MKLFIDETYIKNNDKEIDKESSDILKEILKLREEIEKYNYFYYTKNNPIISDVEYDIIIKKLEALEAEYNLSSLQEKSGPIDQVGSSLRESKFQKIPHKKPMLSLSNSYNLDEVSSFIERIEKNVNKENIDLTYDLELKLDGLSISVIYENGKLERAITRGDGFIGEDVTENVLEIKSIPKYLKEKIDLEVRGEIIIPLSQFKKINEKRISEGEELFANPRNAAAGTLKQLDSKIVAERELDAYFYFLVEAENYGIKTHIESINFISKLGIKTTGICENLKKIEELESRIKYWELEKEKLDYETDGLVIKVDNMSVWEELGNTTKSPRWAIAYKFPAKQITTKLLDITWQVGRTGKITPVAELQEVNLSGSNVKRASLHNFDEIVRKDIKIGDTVFIEKAAEIIPQVVKSVIELRTGLEKEIMPPTHCPVCSTALIKEEGNVDLKCPNHICPGKVQGGIEYFVSRDGMNIIGLGTKIVERLIDEGYIKDVSDIYLLKNHSDELKQMEKMGEKSVENLLESIEKSKNNEFSKTLYSLGIPFVGKFLAKNLAKAAKNLDELSNMEIDELIQIDGVGSKSAKSIYDFFRNENFIEIIRKLREYGVNFSQKEESLNENQGENSIFKDKSFLFTGKLSLFTRDEAQKEVEKKGGIISGSVNKKLDYLVVGEDAGSKLEKAEKIDTVKILTESEFLAILNG
ncbi:MAG: NAD-dependent DNA ligase LigA [Fusobacteriaceae bacterium]|nr:NAD-dependent DNA ligase LigA [Fusobacteriaceae bacterium]